MFDFTGRAVFVGDTVVFNEPGYTKLVEGTIVKFTPKGVSVEYTRSWSGTVRTTFVANTEFVLIGR